MTAIWLIWKINLLCWQTKSDWTCIVAVYFFYYVIVSRASKTWIRSSINQKLTFLICKKSVSILRMSVLLCLVRHVKKKEWNSFVNGNSSKRSATGSRNRSCNRDRRISFSFFFFCFSKHRICFVRGNTYVPAICSIRNINCVQCAYFILSQINRFITRRTHMHLSRRTRASISACANSRILSKCIQYVTGIKLLDTEVLESQRHGTNSCVRLFAVKLGMRKLRSVPQRDRKPKEIKTDLLCLSGK